MSVDLDRLVGLLDLERLEVNLFRGVSPADGRERVFGGQVLGQALVAAARTVDADRSVHSLHAYFLRPGDPKVPIVFDVDRIRDGKSFTTRRVVAVQRGHAIFNLQASFHVPESGPEHSDEMPDVALPDDLSSAVPDPSVDEALRELPIDLRFVQGTLWSGNPRDADQDAWFRADGPLPEDPVVHAAVVAYASDMVLLGTSFLPHREPTTTSITDSGFMFASIDHAMWFHQPCRADEWLLYHCHSPAASGARGFARGEIFTTTGQLCVSTTQEGLVRPLSSTRG